jgi:archaellum component FlaG (FlaF/FlaG flagellin family)
VIISQPLLDIPLYLTPDSPTAQNKEIAIMSDGPQSPIKNIKFINVKINGKKLKSGDSRITTNKDVSYVSVDRREHNSSKIDWDGFSNGRRVMKNTKIKEVNNMDRKKFLKMSCGAIAAFSANPLLAKPNKVLNNQEPAPDFISHPAPSDEPASEDYEVYVNGEKIFCYTSFNFVNDDVYKPHYPRRREMKIMGRPVSPNTFCSFDIFNEVTIKVKMLSNLEKDGLDRSAVVVRPLALGIKPTVNKGEFTFKITKPGPITIEAGGAWVKPLHIFVNPPEVDAPKNGGKDVVYFAAGSHDVPSSYFDNLRDGTTIYVAGGAIVNMKPYKDVSQFKTKTSYGIKVHKVEKFIRPTGKKNITIRGRGIICARKALEARQACTMIRFTSCNNVKIEGVILREATGWTCVVFNSQGLHVDNVKIFGHYGGNDGFMMSNSSNVLVENCFLNNSDDSFEIKAWRISDLENVTFRNCIAWSNVGCSFGLAAECYRDVKNVRYVDCTVIHNLDEHATRGVIGIQVKGGGNVRDFLFENIVIEHVLSSHRPAIKVFNNWNYWNNQNHHPDNIYEPAKKTPRKEPNGNISNITFKNITVLDAKNKEVVIMSDGPQSSIKNINFINVKINGEKLVPGDNRIITNKEVSHVNVDRKKHKPS